MINNKFAFTAVLLLLVAISSTAVAQGYYGGQNSYSTYHKKLAIGLVVNPHMGWLRFGDNDQYDGRRKLGVGYGLLADIGFSENYYFSTGLTINKINGIVSSPNFESGDREYSVQYAEIPWTIKLKSDIVNRNSFYGQFGFTTAFKVGAKEKLETEAKFKDMGSKADLIRLGLQIGGGVEWKLDRNLSLMTGLSFNNGFTRTIKEGSPRNSYLGVNIGLFF